MDNQALCLCDELTETEEFDSVEEFNSCRMYIDDLIRDGVLVHTTVQKRYSEYPEQWYKCKRCLQIWRMVYPNHSIMGMLGIVRARENKEVSFLTFASGTAEKLYDDYIRVQVVIVVTNTGEAPLFLSDSTYDLEDMGGKIIAASSPVQAFPQIILPGENAYFFDIINIDMWNEVAQFRILARPKVDATHLDSIQLEVPELYINNKRHGGLDILGRVKNQTSKPYDRIAIAVVMFDKEQQPIGVFTSSLWEKVPPSAKIGFSGMTQSIRRLSRNDVAKYEVYAFPRHRSDDG